MSYKGKQDKEREGFPFTARQRRRLLGGRKARKVERKKLGVETRGKPRARAR